MGCITTALAGSILIITGLVGLRPRQDEIIEVHPLAPETWDYFCLDHVPYHGRSLTILWDKHGDRYGWGKGLKVLDGGRIIAKRPDLGEVIVTPMVGLDKTT